MPLVLPVSNFSPNSCSPNLYTTFQFDLVANLKKFQTHNVSNDKQKRQKKCVQSNILMAPAMPEFQALIVIQKLKRCIISALTFIQSVEHNFTLLLVRKFCLFIICNIYDYPFGPSSWISCI